MLMLKIGLIARLPLKIKCYVSVMEHVVGDNIMVPIKGLPIPKVSRVFESKLYRKRCSDVRNLTEYHITRERRNTSWEMPWSLSKRSPYERA